ncbi:hypothetical protein QZH41_000610 [Actinostola sp. cb2023]|nr:hypothetical protein QZH41_000610 [Actinostola sp. cb2023]
MFCFEPEVPSDVDVNDHKVKAESLAGETAEKSEESENVMFQNESDSATSSSDSTEEEIETATEMEKIETEPVSEVKRLQKQQELLENKVEELERKLSTPTIKTRLKDSYQLQIAKEEGKQEMLAKRIAYEKRRTHFTWENSRNYKFKSLSKVSERLFYINSLTSKDVLARMAESKKLKEESVSRHSNEQEKWKESKDLGRWGIWRKIDEDKNEEQIDVYRLMIRRPPKATTKFYPPIPDPMAKKRPRQTLPWIERETTKLREATARKNRVRMRLMPNANRVATKRANMHAKQLEFAEKYGLETKDIIEKLLEHKEFLNERQDYDPSASDVARQQLYLMGSLSREHLRDVKK